MKKLLSAQMAYELSRNSEYYLKIILDEIKIVASKGSFTYHFNQKGNSEEKYKGVCGQIDKLKELGYDVTDKIDFLRISWLKIGA